MSNAGMKIVRFTPEDVASITEWFLSYVPTLEIARRLGRSEEVVRMKIFALGLRRSHVVTTCLKWAPEHLDAKRAVELGADQFVEACYAWREAQQQAVRDAGKEASDAEAQRLGTACAEIDANRQLSRNDKMAAKRLAGVKLELIAKQHGVTRERVRQLTSPEYLARKERRDGSATMNKLNSKIAALDVRRNKLIDRKMQTMLMAYESASREIQDKFLEKIGATRNE